jgi:hypothetical protein
MHCQPNPFVFDHPIKPKISANYGALLIQHALVPSKIQIMCFGMCSTYHVEDSSVHGECFRLQNLSIEKVEVAPVCTKA